MNPKTKIIAKIIISIFCVLLFGVFAYFSYGFAKIPVREPVMPYSSLEEEYIKAIEEFRETGKVNLPENTIFTYDGETITIEDKDFDSYIYVSCHTVGYDKIPIYEWHCSSRPISVIIFLLLVSLLAVVIINAIFTSILNFIDKCITKSKIEKLNFSKAKLRKNNKKHYASAKCNNCVSNKYCKCLSCMYKAQCPNCPTPDCVEAFEEKLEEAKKRSF